VGGGVRRPLIELTAAEKAATRAAFETCGLRLDRTDVLHQPAR
jgi:4-hydroxy-tetrahydrodipicolinate synthase